MIDMFGNDLEKIREKNRAYGFSHYKLSEFAQKIESVLEQNEDFNDELMGYHIVGLIKEKGIWFAKCEMNGWMEYSTR